MFYINDTSALGSFYRRLRWHC